MGSTLYQTQVFYEQALDSTTEDVGDRRRNKDARGGDPAEHQSSQRTFATCQQVRAELTLTLRN